MPTDERWSTAEVARMSGVSSRTLRHYDHVGLLTPADTGAGGLRRFVEAARLRRLADTVDRTITERTGGTTMNAEEIFDGFRHDPYTAEARERWGEQAVEAQRRAASWDDAAAARVRDEGEAIHRTLAEALRADTPADDPAVQDVVARHHAWVSRFWTPDAAAYTGLGRLYVDDERFTATIDAHEPGLATYLCAAMAVYAETRLA